MTPNDRRSKCSVCDVKLEINEGRRLWNEGFFRDFCRPCGQQLLDARAARRAKKKVVGMKPLF